MDLHWIVTTLIGIGMSGVGWWAKTLWEAHQKLREDHQNLYIVVTRDYVQIARFESTLRDINENLNRIFDKLDGKEDRRNNGRHT